mmetsp:Transcript_6131/g.15643  ORF Transcript_6131/g.15643 Transcript_6131/m.15643 type:complete len:257 (-) Transcript_6131:553-1323(-)
MAQTGDTGWPAPSTELSGDGFRVFCTAAFDSSGHAVFAACGGGVMTDASSPGGFWSSDGERSRSVSTDDVTSVAAGNADEACSGSLRFLRGDSGSGEEDPSSMAGRPRDDSIASTTRSKPSGGAPVFKGDGVLRLGAGSWAGDRARRCARRRGGAFMFAGEWRPPSACNEPARSIISMPRRASCKARATRSSVARPNACALLRRKAEFHRFFTAFSARPGSSSAIFVQALPQRAWAAAMTASSSGVQPPFFRFGSR